MIMMSGHTEIWFSLSHVTNGYDAPRGIAYQDFVRVTTAVLPVIRDAQHQNCGGSSPLLSDMKALLGLATSIPRQSGLLGSKRCNLKIFLSQGTNKISTKYCESN